MNGVSELLYALLILFIIAYVGWWLVVRLTTIFVFTAIRYYYI